MQNLAVQEAFPTSFEGTLYLVFKDQNIFLDKYIKVSDKSDFIKIKQTFLPLI